MSTTSKKSQWMIISGVVLILMPFWGVQVYCSIGLVFLSKAKLYCDGFNAIAPISVSIAVALFLGLPLLICGMVGLSDSRSTRS